MGIPCSICITSQFLWQTTIYKPGTHLKQSKCWEGQKGISCCAFTFATTAAEEIHIVCVDNFYTLPTLTQNMKSVQTDCDGTVLLNSKKL
jgi:hypothetical protein